MVKIQTEAFRKVTAETAQEICGRADLSAEARPFLLPDLSPQGFLSLLVDAENIGDAIRFLAFALPIREAVWWAYVAAKTNLHAPTELELQCLERAAAWVYAPDEARRRSCMECAESANFTGAAAYAALAVFCRAEAWRRRACRTRRPIRASARSASEPRCCCRSRRAMRRRWPTVSRRRSCGP